ncbi:hypothetical protein RB653_003582 [Dictyostelium firmibasis]|uniref:Solute carrier family 66 member 2 n=1 Tax=Dictyostelium firmibasis TaxID=79012 RepID=A0AAN7YVX7_9MYCE
MASIITSGLFIFAPVIGYVSQYRDIQRTSNSDGFSTRVCLILLLSNILRCYFWIGKQFDITLLYQSLVMIIAQLLMLHLCISIKSRESVTNSKSRRSNKQFNLQTTTTSITNIPSNNNNNNNNKFTTTNITIDSDIDNNSDNDNNNNNDNDNEIITTATTKSNNTKDHYILNSGYFQNFWEWDNFGSYTIFLGVYSAFFLILTTVYLNSPSYFEYLGTLSLTIESILGLPQLIQNYKKRSTKGLSLVLISSWFIGDLFKTLYFYIKDQPSQFIFCGTVQLIIDILISLQIIYYK